MQGSAVKDSRWFSFFDNGMAWDSQWHALAMTHSFSFWLDGKDPWNQQAPNEACSDDHYSMRSFAWNAPRMQSSRCMFETSGMIHCFDFCPDILPRFWLTGSG